MYNVIKNTPILLTNGDIENKIASLLDIIGYENPSEFLHIVYKNPKIWFNFALDSIALLKTAELVRYKKEFIYSSDEFRNDTLSILNLIINNKYFKHQKI